MEQRLILVTLGVDDLARARGFYEGGLGWKRGNDNPDVAFYQMPGMILALWSRASLAADAGVSDPGAAFAGLALAYSAQPRGGRRRARRGEGGRRDGGQAGQ